MYSRDIITEKEPGQAEQYILEHYRTETYADIGRTLGLSAGTVWKKAKEIGIKKNSYNRWTDKEIQLLKDNWKTEGSRFAEKLPRHTLHAVRSMARELGLSSDAYYWSDNDDRYLKENFGIKTDKEIAETLGRDEKSIRHRAYIKGLRKSDRHPEKSKTKWVPWTEAEISFLMDHIDDMTDEEIAEKLGRKTRSVQNKIYSLKKQQKKQKDSTVKYRMINKWSDEDLEFLVAHLNDMSSEEIAEHLSRDKKSIDNKKYILKLQSSSRQDTF